MSTCLPALLFVLALWWGGTLAVLYLDGLPRGTFAWSVGASTLLLGAALYGIAATADTTSAGGAYVTFGCALAVWAWVELTFYTGLITGPRRHACAPGCHGVAHFGHALMASLYHEVAVALVLGGVALLTWGADNQFALWTLLVLAWMHESARLNVFLGVRNTDANLLPDHLAYLRGFMAEKPMNLLFPVSVTASTLAAAWFVQRAATSPSAFDATGYTLLSALMVLAILEHWFLVLPIPAAKLWRWGLRSRRPGRAARRVAQAVAPVPAASS